MDVQIRGGMITHLEVIDYQSLKHADLPLGPFTVITGPTGAGKSAVIRAMRLLAFNAKGTSYIRHGEARALAAAGITDGTADARLDWSVGIERGGRGKDRYYVAPSDGGDVQTYTKLAGGVPEEITAALCLTELNFSGQFDRPFLLTSSAGDVARRLGELTNVTLVFTAGREARRRQLRLGEQVKLRQADLASLEAQRAAFAGLPVRLRAAQLAAEARDRAGQAMGRLDHLDRLVRDLGDALQAAVRVQAMGTAPVPSLGQLVVHQARVQQLAASAGALHAAAVRLTTAQANLEAAQAQVAVLERELHDSLGEAPVCPACGQVITQQQRSQ